MDHLFQIFLVTETDAARIAAAPDNPHRHTYEELIVGMEGRLEHFIDYRSEKFEAPFVSYVTRGKVHRALPEPNDGRCRMWVIRFKSEFIAETTFQLYSRYHDQASLQLDADACFSRIGVLCQMIHEEMQQVVPDYSVVRNLLSTVFLMIESERKKAGAGGEETQKTQNVAFRRFLEILEENFREPLGVDFYAEKLFMSSRNLNLICQQILNKSVLEIIETRKLLEAKNLLISTEKPVSEIGYELGYREKAYFTNVFKKKSGQTPTEFREEMRKLLS